MDKRLAVVLVTAAAIGAAWLALRRSDPSELRRGLEERDKLVDRWIKDGHKAFKQIPVAPLAELSSPADVRAVLAKMDFRDREDGLRTDELLEQLSHFIYFRLVARDLIAYKKWRRDHAYVLTSLAEMEEYFVVSMTFEAFCGGPIPAGATSEEIFDALWQPVIDAMGGAGRPVSIATEPAGLTTVFGSVSASSPSRQNVAGLLPAELWRGGTGGYSPNWWRRPLRDHELFKRYKQVRYAEVGVILEYANKVRRPLVTTWYFDPQHNAWRLEYVHMYNHPGAIPVLVY